MESSPTAGVTFEVLANQFSLRPKGSSNVNSLGRYILDMYPGLQVRRSAHGINIGADQAIYLRDIPGLSWSESALRALDNRQDLASRLATARDFCIQLQAEGRAAAEIYLPDNDGIRLLDDHQCVNVAAMTQPGLPGLCLFDEQGLGKTVSCIFAFDLLAARDEVDLAVIVAPKNMLTEWPKDFSRFMGDRYAVQIVAGNRREKLASLRLSADVFVTNYECMVSMESDWAALLRARRGRVLLVIDESFFVKNLDSKRTVAIRRLREFCSRAFVLCGTPAPNSPSDMVEQFNIADFGNTFFGVEVPKERCTSQLIVSEVMGQRGVFLRHTKGAALPDLPPRSFHRLFVPMSPLQLALYSEALDGYVRELRSATDETFSRTLTSFLAKRIVLLQLCSNPASVLRDYAETPGKLLALDQLLNTLIRDRGEKVILWSFFTASVNALCARYETYCPVRFDGTITEIGIRREAVRRFQEDDKTMLFIANPAAAGAGLTLHRARYAIYESFSNQAAHYLQSLDRIHRRGQSRDVEYVVLLCQDSIEIEHYEVLLEKERMAQELLGDPKVNIPTRASLLAEGEAALSRLKSA